MWIERVDPIDDQRASLFHPWSPSHIMFVFLPYSRPDLPAVVSTACDVEPEAPTCTNVGRPVSGTNRTDGFLFPTTAKQSRP
jgi:hypothetical protein